MHFKFSPINIWVGRSVWMLVPWWWRRWRCGVRPGGPDGPRCLCRRSGCQTDARPNNTLWSLSRASVCSRDETTSTGENIYCSCHWLQSSVQLWSLHPKTHNNCITITNKHLKLFNTHQFLIWYLSTHSLLFTSQTFSEPPTLPAARNCPHGDQTTTLMGCRGNRTKQEIRFTTESSVHLMISTTSFDELITSDCLEIRSFDLNKENKVTELTTTWIRWSVSSHWAGSSS